MAAQVIKKAIERALLFLDQDDKALPKWNLEVPPQPSLGDYATNVALLLAKKQSKNPQEVSALFISQLRGNRELMDAVADMQSAGPGFINFYLKDDYLLTGLQQMQKDVLVYLNTSLKTGRKITIEFGQPNTHKLPHIGHLYSYILGSALSNLLEATGNTVRRVNYQGDVGLHVAKCLWAFQKQNPSIPEELESKVQLLQQMYQMGSRAYDEDEKAKQEIIAVNKAIYDQKDNIKQLWQQTREWNLAYYQLFEKRLGITYDQYYFESQVYVKAIDIVNEKRGEVFKESEGAVIFEGSKWGLHDRVFLTQYNTPTYEAKDLALALTKLADWPCDELIVTTANEQNEYFKVVFKALETLDPFFANKLHHIGFGMINLKSGKMSSRTGNIISAVELVDMVVSEVAKINKEASEVVGIGAVKYAFLKNGPYQNTTFDLEESISTEGNSGPYIQYVFARTQSVLQKSTQKNGEVNVSEFSELTSEEKTLLRILSRFGEVIEMSAKMYSPNILCDYLFQLARAYNQFYNNNKIIGSDQEQLRILLTDVTGKVIKHGLGLLGIASPEKM